MSQIVKESNCGTAPTMRMDDNITAFEDCLGGCERILKTPVPLSYTVRGATRRGWAPHRQSASKRCCLPPDRTAQERFLSLPSPCPRVPHPPSSPPQRHTSRFLMIWLTLLPFSLYSTCGLSTIPLCVIIAFLLLGERRARTPGRTSGAGGVWGRSSCGLLCRKQLGP
jgi:putative membrane protein